MENFDDRKNQPVVTGLGMISAIGNNVAESWQNAVKGVSGIKQAMAVNTENCYSSLAAEVTCSELYNIPDADKMDRAVLLCIKACKEAMKDADISGFGGSPRASVIMGSCVGGVNSAEHYYRGNKDAGDINKISISPIANHVAQAFNAGGVVTNIANACAAGTISIAYACDLIRSGKADVVIAGGADAFASVPYAGFTSLQALDKDPCSPFNKCKGITLGEGAGAIIIESFSHAKERGAKIYCEVLGAGVSSDAYHITAPRPDGEGQMFAIRRAMQNAGVLPADINYINAHGTGTAKNDEAEFLSLHAIFDGENSDLSVSSTKAMTGHCLGAAGAMEAVFAIKALCEGVVPPTVGYTEDDYPRLMERAGGIDFCPNTARKKQLQTVMSNSFAFGGNNASVIFSRREGNVKPKNRERIYITGIGVVSPIGNGKQNYIDSIKQEKTFVGNVAQSTVGMDDYNACGLKMAFYRKLDKFSQLQAVSGKLAVADAGLEITDENATDIGIAVGTCDGPMSTICDYQQDIIKKGNAAGSAFKFPNTVYNAAGGYLSICTGIRGYNVTLTNGTQSGLESISYAMNIIREGQASAVLATGTDENSEIMTELYTGLNLIDDDPYDGWCNGMRLADGSTTLVIESESSVKKRGAKVYCEVLGCATATSPVEYGTIAGSELGLVNAVLLAVKDAGILVDDIDAVVGFADGVLEVDAVEYNALNRLFGARIDVMPTFNINGYVGEGRAATAALSAAHAALMLSGEIDSNIRDMRTILVISYGFGGVYTAVILKKTEEN